MKRYFSPVIAAAIAAIFMLLSSSCSKKTHNLPYFKDITEQTTVVEAPAVPDLVIQPDDELFISVSSADPAATAHFNLPVVNPARTSELSASMQPKQLTYIVDSKGDIIMPELGKVHVAGLTVEQLQNQLTASISRWVENPQVNVRQGYPEGCLRKSVVRDPLDRVNTTDNTLNILDAISAAGDLTQYGLRDRVMLIRNEGNKQKRVILDLGSADLLTSEYFYLRPGDYIYVTPNQVKEDNAKYDSNKAYNLSKISTIVSAASVIASLVIALTVK